MATRAATRALSVHRSMASVAASGFRRFSASSSAEDQKTKMEEELENRVRATMEHSFETRVREIVRSEAREIIGSAAAKVKGTKIPMLLVDNAEKKREIDFKSKLSENRLWLTTKMLDADQQLTKKSCEVMKTISSFSSECGRKEQSAVLKSKLLEGKHELFKNNLEGREVQARVSLLKAMVYVISVPSAIYGAWTRYTRGGK